MKKGGGGRMTNIFFFTWPNIQQSSGEQKKKIVSISFKRLHILNSFEEVKLSICFIICNDLILYKKE